MRFHEQSHNAGLIGSAYSAAEYSGEVRACRDCDQKLAVVYHATVPYRIFCPGVSDNFGQLNCLYLEDLFTRTKNQ